MSYKKAIELSPPMEPTIRRKPIDVLENGRSGAKCQAGKLWHSQLSIPDQILLTLQYWREL